ncbi:hypothetical protein AAVH_02963 [Aphelenchoides avenae]|nr:hypothetical protein AAVH_02963 [Aphelenchus avenae]
MINSSVMLTAKNMQVARLLITCAQANGQKLMDCWDMILATLQHLIWILGMKPTPGGSFRTVGDTGGEANAASAGAPTVLLTTAVSSELPDLSLMLTKLFESTATFDDVSLHHVIAALCKLSTEAMMVAQGSSREPSFFSVAKLLQTANTNLRRLAVFWRPVTAHLLEVCGHAHAKLREWGAVALTALVKSAMNLKQVDDSAAELMKRQQVVLAPLASMSEVEYVDVKSRQVDCLMAVLQSNGHDIQQALWPTIIRIVAAVVDSKSGSDPQLIEQGFSAVSLLVKEFLGTLPFDCVQMLIETDAKYGKQQHQLNVSLASVGQLWDISDYLRRESMLKEKKTNVDNIWLVLYTCLSELCVDNRPPVRKSACDTLLQTVAAHGHALNTAVWAQMIWKILFPMLDNVQQRTRNGTHGTSGQYVARRVEHHDPSLPGHRGKAVG